MKDQIVYVETPISELPVSNGDYTIILVTGEIRAVRWQDDHFEWTGNLPRATHWLKPVELSTLIEDEIKPLNKELITVKEQRNEYEQRNIYLIKSLEKATGKKFTGVYTSKTS